MSQTSREHNEAAFARLRKRTYRKASVPDLLRNWPREDVEYVAKNAGLSPEGIPDADLPELVAAQVLSKAGMQSLLLTATDEEMQAFEKLIDGAELPPEEEKHLELFNDLGLTAVYEGGKIEVLPDAVRSFLLYCAEDPDFALARRQCSWLGICIDMVFELYGACPKKTLYLMYKRRFPDADQDAFWEVYYRIPEAQRYVRIREGRLIYDTLIGQKFFEALGFSKEPYCIPEEAEILDWTAHGYPSQRASWKKLGEALAESGAFPEQSAREEALQHLCEVLRLEDPPEHALEALIRRTPALAGREKTLLPLVREAAGDTRCPALRGFTPLEMQSNREHASR